MDKLLQTFNRIFRWIFRGVDGKRPNTLRMLLVFNPTVMLIMVLLTGRLEDFWVQYGTSLAIGETVSLTCYAICLAIYLIAKWGFQVELKRRTYLFASLFGMIPGLWLGFHVAVPFDRFFGRTFEVPSFSSYTYGLVVGMLLFGLVMMIEVWNDVVRAKERLEKETIEAKFSALTAQMNPHMLFNALNTIASTISTDPQAAEETTLKLSELYRGILSSSKKQMHSLTAELEICRAYLGVESARFGDRLRWTIETSEDVDASLEIPALLLQPLVENAVKHGLSQRASGGEVRIFVTSQDGSLRISVTDDGVGLGKSTAKKGTGTGVANSRSRLELVYGKSASFEIEALPEGGTRVLILLPIASEVHA
ncbi:MAG: sensor histidine kinase [Bdellovibrionota bacterium]